MCVRSRQTRAISLGGHVGLFSAKKAPPPPPKPKGRIKKRSSFATKLFFVWPLYLAVAGGAAFGTMHVRNQVLYQDPLAMRTKAREPSIRILARDGTLIGERGGVDDYIPLDLMPRTMIDAVLATEDKRFFDHHGVDPLGLLRASIANVRAGRFVQGAEGGAAGDGEIERPNEEELCRERGALLDASLELCRRRRSFLGREQSHVPPESKTRAFRRERTQTRAQADPSGGLLRAG